MQYLDKLISKLNKSPIKLSTFKNILGSSNTFFDNVDLEIELLIANGFPIEIKFDMVRLKTANNLISNQTFCIVDIETTAGKAKDGQIIEIGAIKYKDGQIIDKYKSLVSANEISEHIQNLTGITLDMVANAPSLQTVMEEFKIFLEDDIFVAHAISFDYKFISQTLEQLDLGKLANRKLCTIDLSKRVIVNDKYGLEYLRKLLKIEVGHHHRAYDDAQSTAIVFQKCLDDLPRDVKTAEDLIKYSKSDNLKVIKKENN
jgi:DNA polymerase-3 subunit epsilon